MAQFAVITHIKKKFAQRGRSVLGAIQLSQVSWIHPTVNIPAILARRYARMHCYYASFLI